MKPTLEGKVASDMPLSVPEIMKITGYGRRAMQKIKPPLVCKKIRLSDFWRHLSKWHVKTYKAIEAPAIGFDFRPLGDYCVQRLEHLKATGASPEPSRDLRSTVDKLRVPNSSNALQGASPNPGESPPRNTEL